MSKRPSLSEALRHASGRSETPAPEPTPSPTPRLAKTPSRRGKKTIAGFFDPGASLQLKQIALHEGSNVQELLREAINDLFEKRGKSRIA